MLFHLKIKQKIKKLFNQFLFVLLTIPVENNRFEFNIDQENKLDKCLFDKPWQMNIVEDMKPNRVDIVY